MSGQLSEPGCLPLAGPVPYMSDSPAAAEALLDPAPLPARRRWFHGTSLELLPRIAVEGLIPSCWRGGEGCVIFGEDRVENIPARQPVAIEIESRCLPGQLKSWWVSPSQIRGAHVDGEFVPTARFPKAAQPAGCGQGCACGLSPLVEQEQARWRAACAGQS